MMMEAVGQQCHGSLVAFEGPADIVSTQLGLLPTCSQVLILPSVQHYMTGDSNTKTRFSARSYVKDVHEAALVRRDVALQFLNELGRDNKTRLVFLHGGTASAVAQCISVINERQTFGDIHRAESIFRDVVRDGTKGLDLEEKHVNQEALDLLDSERDREAMLREEDDDDEDPITRAMRAADVLYQETESLQPIDCYIRTRPRSLSLPMLAFSDDPGEDSPFFVFGAPPDEEDSILYDMDEEELASQPKEEATRQHETQQQHTTSRDQQGTPPRLRVSVPNRLVGSAVESGTNERSPESRSAPRPLSLATDNYMSPPATPDGVVYGEARLVQMQASKSHRSTRKTRSLDDLALDHALHRRAAITMGISPPKNSASPLDSPEAKSRHWSIVEDPYSSNNLLHLPDVQFVKAHTTTIRKSPTFTESLPRPAREIYNNHQGSDAAARSDEQQDESYGVLQPVLPLHEDLVIHFTGEGSDYVLDSIIHLFRDDASYPRTVTSPYSFGTMDEDSYPSTPRTVDLFDLEDNQIGLSPVAEVPSSDEASDYGPSAARGNHDVRAASNAVLQPLKPPPPPPPLDTQQQPSTPAQTPISPVARQTNTNFHDLSFNSHPNAVAMQNALRVVLDVYFPSRRDGEQHRFSCPSLFDAERLWKPIFEESETTGNKKPRARTADLILAIGCQRGVRRELFSALTGQVEKLGSRSNGMSRSGRLDIRYLIANAMHSITTQHLIDPAHHKILDHPYLLACLLVPQLETYLASNTMTRFLLLEYPAEHLATVLALQELIGSDMLKVAGIIDAEASSPSSEEIPSSFSSSPSPSLFPLRAAHISSRSASSSNASSEDSTPTIEKTLNALLLPGSPFIPDFRVGAAAVSSSSQPMSPFPVPRNRQSFSRADYLLPSTATEAEIASFISAILKALVEIDSFYMPDMSRSASASAAAAAAAAYGTRPAAVGMVGRGARPLPSVVSRFTAAPVSPPLSPSSDVVVGRRSPSALLSSPPAPPVPPIPPFLAKRDSSPSRGSIRSARSRLGVLGLGHIATPGPRSLTNGGDEGHGMAGGPPSLYAVSMATETEEREGEFYDDEERRLMPMYMRTSELRKGNSRKAMKWLGLT
ncbi:hypothetical protein M406DRAFT_106196 [Cryphonectria parasitica EP155]|uniref:Gastric mucin-like protein n=1 Tax=Cryphonectria parasitica (strain ATCC 38755 / EP155) TaxID=660469 RepID=A0A9P4Y552_CRYP1|nr:uncharacterized protein M406DRAFT_106196 [Cryphonectria parasitica EP155]KAF3766320.1 hypothetical protein M406DRAFT_106196 [Cryphonectria parasitica EP155]